MINCAAWPGHDAKIMISIEVLDPRSYRIYDLTLKDSFIG